MLSNTRTILSAALIAQLTLAPVAVFAQTAENTSVDASSEMEAMNEIMDDSENHAEESAAEEAAQQAESESFSKERSGATGRDPKPRVEVNAGLPNGLAVDALVKLPSDGDPDTDFDSTVYYIGLDGKRHPILSSQVFESWYGTDYRAVGLASLSDLAEIPFGEPVLVRPGTYWVKISSDPKTYLVEPGNELRWIKDEETAIALGGPQWNKNIIDVDVNMFTFFKMGQDIDMKVVTESWPTGGVVRHGENGKLFYVSSTHKLREISEEAFAANRFLMRFVRELLPETGVWNLEAGTNVTAREDALFSLMH